MGKPEGSYVKNRTNALKKNMLCIAKFDGAESKEPVYIFRIKQLFVVEEKAKVLKEFKGTWMRIVWWGAKPHITGKYQEMRREGENAVENVGLDVSEQFCAPVMIHWSEMKGKYPVLTNGGKIASQVKRLVADDIRLQGKDGTAEAFKGILAKQAEKSKGKGKKKTIVRKDESEEENESSDDDEMLGTVP